MSPSPKASESYNKGSQTLTVSLDLKSIFNSKPVYASEVQVSAGLSDGHLIRHASPKLYADNFGILHFDGGNSLC